MSLEEYFESPQHRREIEDIPVLQAVNQRFRAEKPFKGETIVFGHVLVANSMFMIEALQHGGARVVLSDAQATPGGEALQTLLEKLDAPVLPVRQAVRLADVYLDVGAVLGRAQTPRAAAEVTRTGVVHYQNIDCPVVSADDCRSKYIEGFYGTGDGLLRAWKQLRPDDPIQGKRALQFGYGKIGRGVALQLRKAGVDGIVVEASASAEERAAEEGFDTLAAEHDSAIQETLLRSDLVIGVTGVPGILSRTYPASWFEESGAVLISLGAEDEYGESIDGHLILGGRGVPLNFHLTHPTASRYIDPVLAAHLLALEEIVLYLEDYADGVHPLPESLDRWVIQTWRKAWPDEDLTGIGDILQID